MSDYYEEKYALLRGLLRLAEDDNEARHALISTRIALQAYQHNDSKVVIYADEALGAWRKVGNIMPFWRAKELAESLAGIDVL